MLTALTLIYLINGLVAAILAWREYRITAARFALWVVAWPIMLWHVSKGGKP